MAIVEYQKARRASLVAAGRCVVCGKKSDYGFRCKSCSERNNAWMVKKHAAAVAQGLCRNCSQDAILTTRGMRGRERSGLCAVCYLKRMASGLLGSSKKWQILLDKLYRYDWKCHYTGATLVLGDNLSFDHMNPVSRFPEQAHDSRNLVPATWEVNQVKRNLTKAEFLTLASVIAAHTNEQMDQEEARARELEPLLSEM